MLFECYRLLAHIHLPMKHCLDRYIFLSYIKISFDTAYIACISDGSVVKFETDFD